MEDLSVRWRIIAEARGGSWLPGCAKSVILSST
jgi:hypothetical protein